LGDFNEKLGREAILKPTIGNDSLCEVCNYNVFRVVYFETSKYFSRVQRSNIATFEYIF